MSTGNTRLVLIIQNIFHPMVSPRKNQQNEQKSSRVLRRELMEKNDAQAPKKHKQIKALFL